MGKQIHLTEKELLIKEKRIMHWGKYHSIPTVYDLINSSEVRA